MKTVTLVFCDRQITGFMQASDVFDSSKVLVMPPARGTVEDDWGQAQVDFIQQQCQGEPFRLIAAGTDGADGFCWIDPKVKVVSDGQHWTPFANYLANLGIGSRG